MPTILIGFIVSAFTVLNIELVIVLASTTLALQLYIAASGTDFSLAQNIILYVNLFFVPISISACLVFVSQLFANKIRNQQSMESTSREFFPRSFQLFISLLGLTYAVSSVQFQSYISQAILLAEGVTIGKLLELFTLKINSMAIVISATVLCIYFLQLALELPLILLGRVTGQTSLLRPKHFRILSLILLFSLVFESIIRFYQELR
jgi:hypothetical protein